MMKKMMMTLVAMAFVLTAGAQGVKIAPKMEKGQRMTYNTEMTTSMPGNKEVKMHMVTDYVVSDENADGYVLDVTLTDLKSDVDATDVAAQLITMSQSLQKGVTLSLKTDRDGRPVAILNYDKLKEKLLEAGTKVLDELYAKTPNLEQMMPRAAMMAQIEQGINEEAFLEATRNANSSMALNGKTVMTGATESYTSAQGLKMQRTYLLTHKDGSAVSTSSRLNMTKDELKQMVIDQVTQSAPEQAEAVKQNIDLVMSQMTFEANETAAYELLPSRWVKSFTVTSVTDLMGQKITTTSRTSLKE